MRKIRNNFYYTERERETHYQSVDTHTHRAILYYRRYTYTYTYARDFICLLEAASSFPLWLVLWFIGDIVWCCWISCLLNGRNMN